MKFTNREYRLSIEKRNNGGTLVIEPKSGFTINFDITRNTQSEANTGNFTITNLARATMEELFQDRIENISQLDNQKFRKVIFEVGYNGDLETVFEGDLLSGVPDKQQTETLFKMECRDSALGFYQSFVNISYNAETTKEELVKLIANEMKGVVVGTIIMIDGKTQMGKGGAITGKPFFEIQKLTKNTAFIDNGILNILPIKNKIRNYIVQITPNLLTSTPKRDGINAILVPLLFAPDIKVKDAVNLKSNTAPQFDGEYLVIGIKHSGTISEVVDGKNETTLFLNASLLNQIV
jgi:hypothetical protein